MLPDAARLGIGLAAIVVIVYWTARRASGDGADPTLRVQSRSETGSMGFLLSGVHAVALVALVGVLAFLPEVMSGAGLLVVVLFAIVAAHWVVEKREVNP